jgi:hypothetical protein
MGLETWSSLRPHQPTIAETQQLFEVVDRDLSDASKDVSPDTRFSLAYNAALKLCTIALHAEGYEPKRREPGQHLTAVNSLEQTLGEKQKETMVFLSRCSRKRGRAMYERVGVVSRQDADDLVQTARKLRADVVAWLRRRHPGLVPDVVK